MKTEDRTTRRGFLRTASTTAALAGVGLLGAGCAAPDTAGAVPVRYWNFFTGGDGQRMVGLIDAFRAARPDVTVRDTTLAWGPPYYTKLAMAAAGGLAPDLASLHASRLVAFAPTLLDPWDTGELAARGITVEQFPQAIRDRVVIDGALMALPLDVHPLVLYANTDVCARAGLLAPDGTLAPITGAQGLLDAGRAAAAVTGGTGIAHGGADDLNNVLVFWSVFRQLGGRMDLPVGGTVQVDRDALVGAMAFLRELCDGTVAPAGLDGSAATALFASGRTGLLLQGPWEITTAQTAGIPFTMVPFPALYGDVPYVRADSHCFVLPRQTRGADPAARTAAYDLAASMLRDSLDWARGGHIPALSAVRDGPQYRALEPQAAYAGAAEVAALDPPVYFAGSGSTMFSRTGQSLQGVTSRALTPEQGADDLVGWLDGQLRLDSPVGSVVAAGGTR